MEGRTKATHFGNNISNVINNNRSHKSNNSKSRCGILSKYCVRPELNPLHSVISNSYNPTGRYYPDFAFKTITGNSLCFGGNFSPQYSQLAANPNQSIHFTCYSCYFQFKLDLSLSFKLFSGFFLPTLMRTHVQTPFNISLGKTLTCTGIMTVFKQKINDLQIFQATTLPSLGWIIGMRA